MEVEQLLGVVRHMRAQKQALDYLDEVLTVIVESKDRVAAAEKALAAVEARTKERETAVAQLEEYAKHKKQSLEDELNKRRFEASAEIAKAKESARHQHEVVTAQIESLCKAEQDHQDRIGVLRTEIERLEKERNAIEQDVARVKASLAQISASIARV